MSSILQWYLQAANFSPILLQSYQMFASFKNCLKKVLYYHLNGTKLVVTINSFHTTSLLVHSLRVLYSNPICTPIHSNGTREHCKGLSKELQTQLKKHSKKGLKLFHFSFILEWKGGLKPFIGVGVHVYRAEKKSLYVVW